MSNINKITKGRIKGVFIAMEDGTLIELPNVKVTDIRFEHDIDYGSYRDYGYRNYTKSYETNVQVIDVITLKCAAKQDASGCEVSPDCIVTPNGAGRLYKGLREVSKGLLDYSLQELLGALKKKVSVS